MTSCLYECHVMHARFAPRAHRFAYRIFLFALDLDELEALGRRLRFFSTGRRNLYSFRDADFLPTHEPVFNGSAASSGAPESPRDGLKARVVAHLASHGIDLTGGRVLLVALPRVLGYLFNPVAFYFCYDRHGTPVAALSEVTNTFKEMKPYVLRAANGEEGAGGRTEGEAVTFRLRVPKHFYVSPFSDVDVAFDFTLRTPGRKLSVQIDDYVGNERMLTSTLSGTCRPLSDARLAWFTLKYPFMTLQVIGLIHWHAFRLWWKNIPWFAKADRAADQRDLYRPHASLTSSTAESDLRGDRVAKQAARSSGSTSAAVRPQFVSPPTDA